MRLNKCDVEDEILESIVSSCVPFTNSSPRSIRQVQIIEVVLANHNETGPSTQIVIN